jgi:hypothetical protein
MASIHGVPLHRRVHSAYGRARLAEAAYIVALDAIHPCAAEITREADRDWLNHAIERPIRHAVDSALDTLARELDEVLDGAPGELLVLFGSVESGSESRGRMTES